MHIKESKNNFFFFVDIRQSDPNFFIGKGFYVDVMCFLTFNVFAAAGNLLADVVEFVSIWYIKWSKLVTTINLVALLI